MQILNVALSVLLAAFLATPTSTSLPESAETLQRVDSHFQVDSEEDALYCEIECPDGRTLKCWLCNCQKLASSCGGSEE